MTFAEQRQTSERLADYLRANARDGRWTASASVFTSDVREVRHGRPRGSGRFHSRPHALAALRDAYADAREAVADEDRGVRVGDLVEPMGASNRSSIYWWFRRFNITMADLAAP